MIRRLSGESAFAIILTTSLIGSARAESVGHEGSVATAAIDADDGWRRGAAGWEQVENWAAAASPKDSYWLQQPEVEEPTEEGFAVDTPWLTPHPGTLALALLVISGSGFAVFSNELFLRRK